MHARRLILAGGVAGALTIASGVLASDQFAATFELTPSRTTPGSSAGLSIHMTWSDPGEPGGKPREIKRIRLDFQRGTRFDTTALPRCRASNAKLRGLGPRACPRASQVGSGATSVNNGTLPPFATRVTFFNADHQIIVVVRSGTTVLAVFRDEVRGATITINLKIPTGFALTELRATLGAHSRRVGGRRRIYYRTPPGCPPTGHWTTTATFTYVDGFSQTLASSVPCAANASA